MELKPCPYCGGIARITEFGIACTAVGCGADMRYPFLGATKSDLINTWNRRVSE